jgi:hypothetical protein
MEGGLRPRGEDLYLLGRPLLLVLLFSTVSDPGAKLELVREVTKDVEEGDVEEDEEDEEEEESLK